MTHLIPPDTSFWMGQSCTGDDFWRQDLHASWHRGAARQRLLNRVYADYQHAPWPFCHRRVSITQPRPWIDAGGWELDPLVIHLCDALNALPEVETYTSCQGSVHHAADIKFVASLKGAQAVYHLLSKLPSFDLPWYDTPILTMGGQGNGRQYWSLHFHDPLALIRFTRDVLQISVDRQVNDFLPPKNKRGLKFPSIINPNEIELVLDSAPKFN